MQNISRRSCRLLFLAAALAVIFPASRVTGGTEQQGQQPQLASPQASASAPATSAGVIASEEDYRIGASDVIEILVEDATELSGQFRVGSNGTFLMPYLGRITAAGKTPEELGKLVTDGLRGRYLKNPQVKVAVKQYNSRAFFIQGAVKNPGLYQIEGRPSLLKLITIAGGLAENHGSSAFIMREERAPKGEQGARENKAGTLDGDYRLIQVSIGGLLKGRFDQNVTVEPGDIVNIPPMDVFFVAGEVREPGSFPLKEGTTLRQAISLAQGTTFEAAKDRAVIFREDGSTGKREEIKVDVGAVMSGKKDDLGIIANDIIIIPNSRVRSVGGALLRAFGIGTVNRGVPVRY